MTIQEALAELRSTSEAAEKLAVPYWVLNYLVRARLIPRPAKDSAGRFWWAPADLDRARAALAARGADRKGGQT